MVREISSIILEARLIAPKRVPAALSSIFDPLVNALLPKMGFQMAVEFFETGWLLFFGSVSDFRSFFGRPMFSTPRSYQTAPPDSDKSGDGGITWDFTFVRLPPRPPESTLAKLLKRFYGWTGSLSRGLVEEIVNRGASVQYRIHHPCLADYLKSAEELVKNTYNLYITLHANSPV